MPAGVPFGLGVGAGEVELPPQEGSTTASNSNDKRRRRESGLCWVDLDVNRATHPKSTRAHSQGVEPWR